MRQNQKLVADIRTLIGPADPARANLEAGITAVINVAEPAVIMTTPRPRELRRRRQPRPGRPRLAIAGAMAFAVVAAAVAVAVAHSRGAAERSAQATPQMLRYVLAGYRDPAASSTLPPAQPELTQLAAIAARQPQPQRRSGAQIGYVVTAEWNLSVAVSGGTSAAVLAPQLDQTWTSPAGDATQTQRYGSPQDLSGASEPSPLVRAAESGLSGSSTQTYPTTEMFGPLVSGLSTQPDQLQTQLINAAPADTFPDWSVSYYLIKEIAALQHQVVSSQLESALWQVLATRSDIRYMGLVTDRAGRPGEAFCQDASGAGGERLVLIISPKTGLLLGEEDLFRSNPGALTIASYPAVIGYVTYLSQSYVPRVGK
jgi:hypothetical protein